jgi:GNAT superfamily N-acetyltransferase
MTPTELTFVPLSERPRAVPLVARWWLDDCAERRPDRSLQSAAAELAKQEPNELPLRVLAERRGEILGVASLTQYQMRDALPDIESWIGSLYVVPRARGGGVASALAQRMERFALARRVDELHVWTERLDGGLYAKLGWEPLQTLGYEGRELLILSKHLTALRRDRA